ncbi:tyrosine-type recombinase/integrase, partial [Geobacillus zalihae]|uniref:tyrosine-type recombinase/integrase n=2 Tax=Anoxybacillaceae TaxID=3120669 RepID=UPI000ABFBC5B
MNFVQPIRDPEKIAAMKKYLLQRSKRNYILFVLGINTGLRISDLLQLKKEDLLQTHLKLREKKTRKEKRIRIPPAIRKELIEYAKTLKDGE